MKFCPKCGAPLVPKKKGKSYVLKCSRCGYEAKATKKELGSYGLKYEVDSTKRTVTGRATEARETKLTPEEREMLQEYYEVFLQEFAEEAEESGEAD